MTYGAAALLDPPPAAKTWIVIFHRDAARWIETICPGRFKHVSMAGFIPETKSWVVLSWGVAVMRVGIVRDENFEHWLPEWAGSGGGCLLARSPDNDSGSWWPRFGLCVPMVCHVLGIRSGALLPDTLWRLLLANGAEVIVDGTPESARADGPGENPTASGRARPA